MLKATLQGAVLLGLLAWSAPSFAEVQNVQVGGDITVRGFYRSSLDLTHDDTGNAGAAVTSVTNELDNENFFMATTGINIGADLTENVSAFIRLANERDWNVDAAGGASGDIDISQAYLTLKELFYTPLTLTIGTQPIVWGRGFVLGSNLLPAQIYRGGVDRNASITADEFTDFTSFDAIRATLDLSGVAGFGQPLMLDYVYIRIDENFAGSGDDVTLQGFNLGTQIGDSGSEAEIYYLNKRDQGIVVGKNGSVSTIGLRGSAQPVAGSYFYGELAYQFGKRGADPSGVLPSGDAQQAWAANFGAEYTFADISSTPKLGAEWIFFSGKDLDGAVNGWDPIARGYFTTAIREFQDAGGLLYTPDQTCFASNAAGSPCTGSTTNQHQFSLYGSMTPIEDLTIAPRLSWFILDEGVIPDSGTAATRMAGREHFAGTEWDTVVTYDYTDDVQFGVIYGLFIPGSVFRSHRDSTAQELITSVSVKF